ncbi:MAG: potassium channel beta subunit family protein [Candidatus Dormibacteria bacterium]
MPYRRLGRSGLRVSLLSLGSWVTFGTQVDEEVALACMRIARERGVNFFDNAESYAAGESERIMGIVLAKSGWSRRSYVISTKFFWGIHGGVNVQNTLNRKYLLQAMDDSLERLQLDFVDLVFCHRPDPETDIEETVWAMHDLVSRGKALYWGTSEWPAADIRAAHDIAERHHLHKPLMEQSEYNLFTRHRVETEYQPLYEGCGLGLTTWSPLASGLLTGKYLDGIPQGSRAAVPGYEWLHASLTDAARNESVRRLLPLAEELGCTPAQLAIAWCASNPRVSTVITGATSVAQVEENLNSLAIMSKLTPTLLERIDGLFTPG